MSRSQIEHFESHIFLVGFMASGKSTVGPILAAELDRPFINLDDLIEAKTGCTIAELIARDGEGSFRRIETETLRQAAQDGIAVIAPGGGAITIAENRELMSRFGVMVWLDAPFELCWRRILQDGAVRPLAPDKDTTRGRYEKRLSFYRRSAIRIAIDDSHSPDQIAGMIVGALQL